MTAAILDFRPARLPGSSATAAKRMRLSPSDRLALDRPRLACHWRRGPDGRLIGVWEPDIPSPLPALALRR